ncbi:MAG: hypothetical protein ACM3IJ_05820 [Candidatus Levyibacteriota bacterium]
MNSRTITLWISLLLAFLASLGIGLLVYYHPQSNTLPPVSVINMDTIPSSPLSSAPPAEPSVTSWQDFNNDKYLFDLQIPNGWISQDFSPQFQKGGTLFAFSPTSLPCPNCTYVHDGFFSLKIYNKTTDPEAYQKFDGLMKAIGKGPQGVMIDGRTGVLTDNMVAVENTDQGWVYEFDLDTNNGNTKALDSRIFQRAVSSFKFTGLKFK